MDLVTVGVFSWAQLEPAEGRFSFEWLRDVLNLLSGAGIGVGLATPTAAPPAWLSRATPMCFRSIGWVSATATAVVRASVSAAPPTAKAGGDCGSARGRGRQPRGNRDVACSRRLRVPRPLLLLRSPHGAFRQWLAERHGSLGAINEAWGTTFWSQTYTDLDQVVPPRMTAAVANPALELDYKRFCSDAFLEEFLEERAILKAARPELALTTNFMGLYKPPTISGGRLTWMLSLRTATRTRPLRNGRCAAPWTTTLCGGSTRRSPGWSWSRLLHA